MLKALITRWLAGDTAIRPQDLAYEEHDEAHIRQRLHLVRDVDASFGPNEEARERLRQRHAAGLSIAHSHTSPPGAHAAVDNGSAVTDARLCHSSRHKQDRLPAGLKIGANEVLQRLLDAMHDGRGLHTEALLVALGALAGYACQMSLREEYIASGRAGERNLFVVVQTGNGRPLFYGEKLNRPLADGEYSVWSLAAAGAKAAGLEILPNLGEYYRHVIDRAGSASFGISFLPAGHEVPPPIQFVTTLWPVMPPLLEMYCERPSHWPIMLGCALQEAIAMSRGVLDPLLALSIVMESAIAMSKIAPLPDEGKINNKE